jgi:hypothetical protein
MDRAHCVNGFCLLFARCDGGGDLEPIEHEASAAAVDGFIVECSHDLSDGEEDGGGVLDGRYLDPVPPVHAVELHVEEAIRLGLEGGGVAALPIVLDVSALVIHDFSFGGSPLIGGREPLPPGSNRFQWFTDRGGCKYLSSFERTVECNCPMVGDSEPGKISSKIKSCPMPVICQLTFVRCSGMRATRVSSYATAVSSELGAGSKFAGF